MSIQNISDAGIAWSSASTRVADPTVSPSSTDIATKESATSSPVDKNKKNYSEQDVQQAAAAMQDFVQPLNNTLKFSVDKDTGETVVKVIDTSTDKVLKQIPSEDAIALAKALDKLKGLLIQQKA